MLSHYVSGAWLAGLGSDAICVRMRETLKQVLCQPRCPFCYAVGLVRDDVVFGIEQVASYGAYAWLVVVVAGFHWCVFLRAARFRFFGHHQGCYVVGSGPFRLHECEFKSGIVSFVRVRDCSCCCHGSTHRSIICCRCRRCRCGCAGCHVGHYRCGAPSAAPPLVTSRISCDDSLSLLFSCVACLVGMAICALSLRSRIRPVCWWVLSVVCACARLLYGAPSSAQLCSSAVCYYSMLAPLPLNRLFVF